MDTILNASDESATAHDLAAAFGQVAASNLAAVEDELSTHPILPSPR